MLGKIQQLLKRVETRDIENKNDISYLAAPLPPPLLLIQ